MVRTQHKYWVYILSNKPKGVLYTGVTGDINDRMQRHRFGNGSKFTSKYNINRLVYFEEFPFIKEAIRREKQLKNWHRQWKLNLIESTNPNWENLWTSENLNNADPETSSG